MQRADGGVAARLLLFTSTPQSIRLTAYCQLPVKGRLLVLSKLGVQCRTPSRSDRFNGVTGGAGGPKGRNRNLPWPPCKKVIRKLAVLCLFHPLSRLAPTAPPQAVEPFGVTPFSPRSLG